VEFLLLLPLCASCGDILDCSDRGVAALDASVRVVIHWDDDEKSSKPATGMRIHLFAEDGSVMRADRPADGGDVYVAADVHYTPYCYDYNGNNAIYFHRESDEGDFEAYLPVTPDGYGVANGLSPAEDVVAEPKQPTFYVHRADAERYIDPATADELHELHFYPDNVLTEFTFCIYGIDDAWRISNVTSALSGLAAAYDMDKQSPATLGSTVVSADFSISGDSLKGSFTSFGIADFATYNNRLSIVARTATRANTSASWGYAYNGQWEDSVRAQLIGAWGTTGSDDERAAWRAKNHGYDILLPNDGRLSVPITEGPGLGEEQRGPFDVGVSEWDNLNVNL
jgi:hypothetical protein